MQKRIIRRAFTIGLLSLGLLATAALTAGPAQAATSNGPYYAEPSWDQKLACPTIANCPRFIVLADWNSEAVLDRETGLVWEKSPETTPDKWTGARNGCISKNIGGRRAWRLPSIPELTSLVDPANSNPSLPTGHPFLNVQSAELAGYWSATAHVGTPTNAWCVFFNFANGFTASCDKSSFDGQIWCVRGGMNADAY
jgi:hypothetical protein